MHTITLELLRHGPAHNQLLSPLTPYLALCENHGAVTLHVPFEHNQFLHRLDALGYRESDEARVFQLKDTAAILGQMLAQVPGLTAEANKQNSQVQPLTHLRLIISASELALLPFELALSPEGLPGAGQHLLLQSQMPVCLTREVRRAPDDNFKWPVRPPRILFVAAAPPEVGDIPLKAHLLALRSAIEPWVRYSDEAQRNEKPNQAFRVSAGSLDRGDPDRLRRNSNFTHVHILAHGIQYSEGKDRRYALALHDARNPDNVDRVSGARLATALRASRRSVGNGLGRPAVVTMASCDAGNVGSVAGAGASIAHALHEAGIAVVWRRSSPCRSRDPCVLIESLYKDLLWGKDPRQVIYDLRRRLFSQIPTRHDWASLTAYLALPSDFEKQLSTVKIKMALESINAAMSYADEITRQASDLIQSAQAPNIDAGKVIERMKDATKRLNDLVEEIPSERDEIYGLLASTEKRQAEVWFRGKDFWKKQKSPITPRNRASCWWRRAIIIGIYFRPIADRTGRSRSIFRCPPFWPESMESRARRTRRRFPRETRHHPRNPTSARHAPKRACPACGHWFACTRLYDLNHENAKSRSWAHGNLLELYLLSLLPEFGVDSRAIDAERLAIEHADKLIDTAGPHSFEAYSTRRQIVRYLEWYEELTDKQLSPLMDWPNAYSTASQPELRTGRSDHSPAIDAARIVSPCRTAGPRHLDPRRL